MMDGCGMACCIGWRGVVSFLGLNTQKKMASFDWFGFCVVSHLTPDGRAKDKRVFDLTGLDFI